MVGRSRSVRSSITRGCEGALAIGPGTGDAPASSGRRETAASEAHRAIEAIWRIEPDPRVALRPRVPGVPTLWAVARGFLVPVSTIAPRLVRAQRPLAEAHVMFEIPGGPARVPRLASVLEVIYLIFNEGYSATAGKD